MRVDLTDPLLARNTWTYTSGFGAGRLELVTRARPPDVDLATGLAGFSIISKPDWRDRLDAAFDTEPPQCLTRF